MRRMFDASQATAVVTASDLRAQLARAGVRAYILAARLRMHPTTLSLILNGRRAIDSAQARRIVAAIRAEKTYSGSSFEA
jgi:hypothetical protein